MNKYVISSKKAPAAIGPYSQAIRADNFLFISGQIPIVPETGELVGSRIEQQTEQVLSNIMGILYDQGLGPENVVKVTIFLKNMEDFKSVNLIYGEIFTQDAPARETVEVSRLPRDVLVEMSAIAIYS
jgi:2-iminobutanoate/2-iminopropanoate deaminase